MAPRFNSGRHSKVVWHSYDVSSVLNDATVDRTMNTADVTAYGDEFMAYQAVMDDGTVTLTGMHDGSTDRVDSVFGDELGSTAQRPITLCMDGGFTDGRTARLAAGVISGYNVSAPVADIVATDISIQASSGVWPGVITHYGAITATGAQTGVTLNPTGAGSTGGARSHLHVIVDDVTSASFVVQHSSEGSAWADLHTFTAVSAIGSEIIESTGAIKEMVRLNTVAPFTGTSVTVLVATAPYTNS